MSVGAIEAGRAFVRLLVNDTELQKGLKKAQAKLKMFAASTGQLGRSMLGMSAAIGAPLIAGVKVFADFERQMAQVSTMLDDPARFMGQFTEGVKTLAVQFGESTDVLAKGLYDILSASIAPAKAMDVLTASVKAAKAGLSDTGTAADAITTILNAYQMSAEDATKVSDWMFGVVKRGKTTFGELAPNIGNVATIAATAGVSLNELGAMLATLTRNGVGTEEAITALNAIISTFLSPSQEAVEIADRFKIALSSTTIQSEGLLGVFKKLAGLPPDVIAKLFPNIRALKGVLPAIRNLEGVEEDLALLANSAGMTEEAYSKLAGTLTGTFNKLREAIKQAAAEIGAALEEDLSEAGQTIEEISVYVAEWIKTHQGLVIVLGKTAVALAAVGGALLAVSAVAKTAAFALGGVALASKAATASLAFMAANPAVIGLATLAVSVAAIGFAIDALQDSTLNLAERQQELLAQGDKKRQQDVDYLDRLQALSTKQKLSAKEMSEAAAIVQYLQSVYGDLGLTLDKTTGKISGMTAAYGKLSEAQKEPLKAELKAAMMEAQANQQEVVDALQELEHMWVTPLYRAAKQADLYAEGREWKQKHADLLKRYKELVGTNADEGTPEKGSRAAAVQFDLDAIKREEEAAKKAEEFKESLAERMHQAKLQMIDDEYKRELEAIYAKHMAERREAKKTGQDLAALMEVQQVEVGNVHREHQKKRAEEDKRANEDQAREQKRNEEEKAQNQKDLREEIEELEIKSQSKGLDQQLKLLELERRRAVRAAPVTGESVDDINKKYGLLSQIAKMEGVGGIEKRTSVSGTFSAQMARRMGGSAVEEKQLKTQQEIAVNTGETKRLIAGLGRLR